MSKQDYYATLGVDKGADEKALKSAYRKLAMKYHPDKNPGDAAAEQKFKDINEAYDVLKDPQKKAAYDRFGHQAFQGGGFGAQGHPGQGFGDSFSDVFEDLFGEFMGGRRGGGGGRSAARRGADLKHSLNITLEDAFNGIEETIRVSAHASCGDCHGSGAKEGSQPQTCPNCRGTGQTRMQQGFFVVQKTCGNCQGAGQVISDPCRTCSGAGRVQKDKTLSVKIPAGVEDGNRIRLSGEGEAGVRGGPTGDLYLFVSVRPHEIFKRNAENIYCQVPILMTDAVLGGDIIVPTVGGGKAKIKIPAGTQAGKQFRLKGKGMPVINSSRVGDMIIIAEIETPTNLSRAQKDLMKKFSEIEPKSWSPKSSKFFSRMKEFWDDLT